MVESHPPGWTLALHFLLAMLTLPVHLSAYPTSLSDCQTPTGWNCSGFDDREHDLFLCDINTCQFGGECLRIGNTITCDCQLKCSTDYVPVCGSNGNTYQNECYLRQAACKQQSEIKVLGEGSCSNDMGSGSGDGEQGRDTAYPMTSEDPLQSVSEDNWAAFRRENLRKGSGLDRGQVFPYLQWSDLTIFRSYDGCLLSVIH